MAENPYIVLGVKEGAPLADVRKSYRKLAKEFHPDKNPNNKAAEEKFKKISAAFTFLDDEERKAKFDRGEIDADGNPKFAGFGGGGGGGFAGGDPFGPGGPFAGARRRQSAQGGFGTPEFEDFFGDLFGASVRNAGGGRAQHIKGQDLNTKLDIETIDAIIGAKKRINISNQDLDISIPAGAITGQVLRLKGKGAKGVGGAPNGDLLVSLNVKPDSRFRIDGNDVHTELKISLFEALSGGKIELATPSSNVALTIKPNSNSGQVLRLKGRGVAKKEGAGDLFVKILVQLPEGDNSELLGLISNWSKKSEVPKGRE